MILSRRRWERQETARILKRMREDPNWDRLPWEIKRDEEAQRKVQATYTKPYTPDEVKAELYRRLTAPIEHPSTALVPGVLHYPRPRKTPRPPIDPFIARNGRGEIVYRYPAEIGPTSAKAIDDDGDGIADRYEPVWAGQEDGFGS